ncbi:hypothetical protein [Mesorhizobium sp. L-2-11]|uniref:hypothetical protein n=1 Tax=Mesorhizobium sp. L-2-11 TaxID=2744521 RepID=UPI0019272CF9|nr:hypothetical protein [Mesorhizobium sp. L-2-11]
MENDIARPPETLGKAAKFNKGNRQTHSKGRAHTPFGDPYITWLNGQLNGMNKTLLF